MPVFFIPPDSIQPDDTVTITGPLLDHVRGSLRMQTGDELWVGIDGRQRCRLRIRGIDRSALHGHVLEKRPAPSRRGPSLTLGQAVLKGERMDWVIQKATELGAAAVIPLVTARAIARPKHDRLNTQLARWQRIALEASQQAERWDIPLVHPFESVSKFWAAHTASSRLLLNERGAGQGLQSAALPDGPEHEVVLAVGPEGGWDADERRQALDSGFISVSLGCRILRAETAAIAAISIVQHRLGELG